MPRSNTPTVEFVRERLLKMAGEQRRTAHHPLQRARGAVAQLRAPMCASWCSARARTSGRRTKPPRRTSHAIRRSGQSSISPCTRSTGRGAPAPSPARRWRCRGADSRRCVERGRHGARQSAHALLHAGDLQPERIPALAPSAAVVLCRILSYSVLFCRSLPRHRRRLGRGNPCSGPRTPVPSSASPLALSVHVITASRVVISPLSLFVATVLTTKTAPVAVGLAAKRCGSGAACSAVAGRTSVPHQRVAAQLQRQCGRAANDRDLAVLDALAAFVVDRPSPGERVRLGSERRRGHRDGEGGGSQCERACACRRLLWKWSCT